jgi:hypothetical protein
MTLSWDEVWNDTENELPPAPDRGKPGADHGGFSAWRRLYARTGEWYSAHGRVRGTAAYCARLGGLGARWNICKPGHGARAPTFSRPSPRERIAAAPSNFPAAKTPPTSHCLSYTAIISLRLPFTSFNLVDRVMTFPCSEIVRMVVPTGLPPLSSVL